jgi:hypothetical protein
MRQLCLGAGDLGFEAGDLGSCRADIGGGERIGAMSLYSIVSANRRSSIPIE